MKTESKLSRNQLYYLQNKEELLRKSKIYREANKEALAASKKRRREENRDKEKKRRSDYYLRNKEAVNAKNRENNKKTTVRLKLQTIQAYGGRCGCCGEANPCFLTIDHINGRSIEEKATRELCGYALYKSLRDRGYPTENYQLLCMNCNFAKGLYGSCPHVPIPAPTSIGLTRCQ